MALKNPVVALAFVYAERPCTDTKPFIVLRSCQFPLVSGEAWITAALRFFVSLVDAATELSP
jgi:hypothetical protein